MDFKKTAAALKLLVKDYSATISAEDMDLFLELERELLNLSKESKPRDIDTPWLDSKGKKITVLDNIAAIDAAIGKLDYALHFEDRYKEDPLKARTERNIEILENAKNFFQGAIDHAPQTVTPKIPGRGGRLVN
jgi:hypothetical protein